MPIKSKTARLWLERRRTFFSKLNYHLCTQTVEIAEKEAEERAVKAYKSVCVGYIAETDSCGIFNFNNDFKCNLECEPGEDFRTLLERADNEED